MIKTITYHSGIPGKKLLVLGAVHGNEVCGPHAIRRVMAEINQGHISLISGCVTFVPITNQLAYEHNVRYCDENLNRIVHRHKAPTTNEAKIANQLCDLIDTHDALLDLHSFTSTGEPFVFLDYPTEENIAYMESLQLPIAVEAWPAVYENSNEHMDSYDTERYAESKSIPALTVECGQHENSISKAVAYDVIRRALTHFKLTNSALKPTNVRTIRILMCELISRKTQSDQLCKKWKNFEPVAAGQRIASFGDGTEFISSYDGCIVLPKPQGKAGEEFFYLGEIVN